MKGQEREIEEYMEEVNEYGYMYCDNCGNSIEVDCPKCSCGWENPIMNMGLV